MSIFYIAVVLYVGFKDLVQAVLIVFFLNKLISSNLISNLQKSNFYCSKYWVKTIRVNTIGESSAQSNTFLTFSGFCQSTWVSEYIFCSTLFHTCPVQNMWFCFVITVYSFLLYLPQKNGSEM